MNFKAQIILTAIALILVHIGIRMAKWERHLDEEDRELLKFLNKEKDNE